MITLNDMERRLRSEIHSTGVMPTRMTLTEPEWLAIRKEVNDLQLLNDQPAFMVADIQEANFLFHGIPVCIAHD